jgi:hypothetical protein
LLIAGKIDFVEELESLNFPRIFLYEVKRGLSFCRKAVAATDEGIINCDRIDYQRLRKFTTGDIPCYSRPDKACIIAILLRFTSVLQDPPSGLFMHPERAQSCPSNL